MVRLANEPEAAPRELLTRAVFDLSVRKIDAEKRTAEFTAATEGGVDTWSGRQYLRMKGLKLNRFKRNPVILDSHDRFTTDAVVGRAVETRVEDSELVVIVEFAKTPRAENAWQLVAGGFLRALSVGFIPLKIKTVQPDETDSSGAVEIKGPAEIVQQWELYEISVVPVPADMDAVRRGLAHEELLKKEQGMAKETVPPAPAPSAADAAQASPPKTEAGQSAAPQLRVIDDAALLERSRVELIKAYMPQGMEVQRDLFIANKTSAEDARLAFLIEATKRAAPAGTPEPKPPAKTEAAPAEVSDEVLARSICSPRAG